MDKNCVAINLLQTENEDKRFMEECYRMIALMFPLFIYDSY